MSRNIKLLFTFFLGLIIFFILFSALKKDNNYSPNVISNKIETNFSAKLLLKNKKVFLEELIENEDLVLINIWASWCSPCREEHPYLLDLSSTNNIKVIGINYKDSEANAKKFLKKLGNPYSEILIDIDGTKSIELGAYGVPETFLLNSKSKKVIKKYIGPLNDEKFIEILKIIKNEKI